MNNLDGIHSSIYKKTRNKHTTIRSIVEIVETLLVLSCENEPILPTFFETKYKVVNIHDALDYKLTPCSRNVLKRTK